MKNLMEMMKIMNVRWVKKTLALRMTWMRNEANQICLWPLECVEQLHQE